MRPTVSVVIPAWNAAWCIERALESVMRQTAPVADVIVCDDGSEDDTADRVERRYGARARVLRLPHRNASAARADGVAQSRCDWIAFLDADDWWEPEKIERQLAYIERRPDVAWLSGDGDFVSDEGVIRASWLSDYFEPVAERCGDLFEPLALRCFPLMSSSLVRREAYEAVGGIDTSIVHSHDYDLWLRLAARYPGAVLADRLVHYWRRPASLSQRFEARHRDDLAIMRRLAAGEFRLEPAACRIGRERAASLAFDIGLICLRESRVAEARPLFREALHAGPLRRRAFALAGRWLPAFLLPLLRSFRWLKLGVAEAREGKEHLTIAGGRA